LDKDTQQKRNRIIALTFASVLLLVVYGPLAQWFVAADRVLYDQLASSMPNQALDNAYIASIDTNRLTQDEVLKRYGEVIEVLQNSGVRRIILPNPPEIPAASELPGWAALLASSSSVFVPTRHRFANVATRNGFVAVGPDSDNILRRSELWQLINGVKSPSLPLAVDFETSETKMSPSRWEA
jgi:CHASE2 domain-containing sensor protein